jgi:hypothetical protein
MDRSPLRSVFIDTGPLPPAFGSMSTSRKTARPYSGTPESFGLEGIVRKRYRSAARSDRLKMNNSDALVKREQEGPKRRR